MSDKEPFLSVHSAIDDAGLTTTQFRLLAHLYRRAGSDGRIFSAVKDMAATCGIAPNTIKIAMRGLKVRNIITVEQVDGRPSLRRINPYSVWRLDPARKKSRHQKRPGVEIGPTPGTEDVPTPGTKSAPQRISHEVIPNEGIPPLGVDPANEVFEGWNLTELTKARILTPTRRKKIRLRLQNSYWRENWREALGLIAASGFCLGNGNRGWKANIDWFIKSDDVLVYALEGKYSTSPSISNGSKPDDETW